MEPHLFTPDEGVPSWCAECQMPKANRIHQTDERVVEAAGGLPDPAAPTVAPLPFTGTVTSLTAALTAARTSGSVKMTVLAAIASVDADRGMTDYELAQTTDLSRVNPNTLRPRRIDLRNEGFIAPVMRGGKEVQRGGFTAWTLTPAGRVAWERAKAA